MYSIVQEEWNGIIGGDGIEARKGLAARREWIWVACQSWREGWNTHRKEKCNKSIVSLTQYHKRNRLKELRAMNQTDEQQMINGIVA